MEIFSYTTLLIMFKVLLASVLGMVIGFERWYHKQSYGTAGMRTLALVALGSALFTIMSVEGFREFVGITSFDPSRIAGQIVVGIGFLGGGLIFVKGGGVRGLTTAASVWVVAAIGMATGLGFYSLAVFSTLLAIIILWIMRLVDFGVLKPGEGEENKTRETLDNVFEDN